MVQTCVCSMLNKTLSFSARVLYWEKPVRQSCISMITFMSGGSIANCRSEFCKHNIMKTGWTPYSHTNFLQFRTATKEICWSTMFYFIFGFISYTIFNAVTATTAQDDSASKLTSHNPDHVWWSNYVHFHRKTSFLITCSLCYTSTTQKQHQSVVISLC